MDIFSFKGIRVFIKDRPNPDAPRQGAAVPNNNIQLLNTGGDVEYTDETYMVLGLQLNNPYSIPNMTAAYNAYFNTQYTSVSVTHKYIRFSPANEAQIALLDDSLELDLYTHPLDYEMLQDGDLYVHTGGNIEDIPYLYTVVPANYNLAGTAPYMVLADLHLPEGGPAALILEELAESMAAGAFYMGAPLAGDSTLVTRTDVVNSNGEHPTYRHNDDPCEVDPRRYDPNCDGGYTPPPPPPPPPPALVCGLPGLSCVQSGYPRGRIRVWDTQLNQCVPVHDVQVRSKRWFKIDNMYTDIQGMFSSSKQYNNNAKIQIIFRNGEISVKPLRNNLGIRLSLFPVKARIGMFSGCGLNTIDHIFYRTSGGQVNEALFGQGTNDSWRFTQTFQTWLAATAIVARKYQLAQGSSDGVGTMKSRSLGGHRLQVYLSDGGDMGARGCIVSMPMLAYMNKGFTWQDVIDIGKFAYYAFKTYKSVSTAQVIPAIANGLTAAQTLGKLVFQGALPDGILMYNTFNRNLSSSEVHEKFYEIYTNAGLLKNRVNKNDWKNYLKKENNKAIVRNTNPTLFDIVRKFVKSNNDKWYEVITNAVGFASASASLVNANIALNNMAYGELFEMYNGFSEAYAHTLANRRYGT